MTEPEIILPSRPGGQAYVKCYINGQRERFYNGKRLGIKCNPNRHKGDIRMRELERLRYTLKRKLDNGWLPGQTVKQPVKPETVQKKVTASYDQLFNGDYSGSYLRELEYVKEEFLQWLPETNLLMMHLTAEHIKQFLSRWNYSPSMFNLKRRCLSALLGRVLDEGMANPVKASRLKRVKGVLHRPYTEDQMREVLYRLYKRHPNLFLCALLEYGCLLRPHEEIRKLTRGHFSQDLGLITLSGSENKGKEVRTVTVPVYVKEVLLQREVDKLPADANIFSGTVDNYQYFYFNTAWQRIKSRLVEEGLISADQTLYSFRHTAACNIYLKTRDAYRAQRAFGHSSLTVTLRYLRSLGLLINADEKDLPDAVTLRHPFREDPAASQG
jgi:site-specific recombinase XerD